MKFDFSFKSNQALLGLLIESFDKDEKVFRIDGESIFPTLDDVVWILGFPIDGLPVSGKDLNVEDTKRECEGLLGIEATNILENNLLNYNKLCDHFSVIPDDVDDIDNYIRAYVLHAIGTTVLAPKHCSGVPSMYLSLVEDIDKIKYYAWGAAILAHSVNKFTLAKVTKGKKKLGTKGFFGHSIFFFQVNFLFLFLIRKYIRFYLLIIIFLFVDIYFRIHVNHGRVYLP